MATESVTNGAGDTPSELEQKIIKQTEYYFGNMNLPRDKFLQEQVKLDEGWVPLETMIKFNRLKELSTDFEVITNAIKKSTAGLLEVSEDGTKIRRSPEKPLPENTADWKKEVSDRTVYAKGFPEDITLDQLMEYFDKHGKVDNVYMRRDQKKKFKQSVFAAFVKKEDAEKFLAEPEIKYQDTPLLRYSKEGYFQKKRDDKAEEKQQQESKKAEEQMKRAEEEKEKLKGSISHGTIIHLTGFSEKTERDDIRNVFEDYSHVAWVDFDRGDKEAWVRFQEEGQGKSALERCTEGGGKVEINNDKLEAYVLEGDEELEHWRKIFQDQADRRSRDNQSRRGGRGGRGFGGGRGGGRGRRSSSRGKFSGSRNKRSRDEDGEGGADGVQTEPPVKQVKSEETTEQQVKPEAMTEQQVNTEAS